MTSPITTPPAALASFLAVLAAVALLGFGKWGSKRNTGANLEEWGLGGRRYGAWVTWFLVGGDMYTAYTVIAVPGLIYATGAAGFFALPYAILIYPIVFAIMPKLRAVAARCGAVTSADVIYHRYQSRPLEIAVAATGVAAVVPYIALQLAGIEAAASGLGLNGRPILIGACVVLASYTYLSGLQASARIAFLKDIMIYLVVLVAVALIPARLGGYHAVFASAAHAASTGAMRGGLLLKPGQMMPFATLALGSALAAFMYPHTLTGIFAARDGRTIRHNAIALPAYTLLLGLIALMGYMAHAAGIQGPSNDTVPALFRALFSPWFSGFAFAAIAVTALVPASVMAIGAANLFTRNVWEHLPIQSPTKAGEATVAKRASAAITFGALLFILFVKTNFVIDLQLLGGLWILQTFPSITASLRTRRSHPRSLLTGWAVGMTGGTTLAWQNNLGMVYGVPFRGDHYGVYIGLLALCANIAVVAAMELLTFGSRKTPNVTATA